MKILIIGSGGHGRVVANILQSMEGMEPLGYLSNDGEGPPDALGLAVLGRDSDVSSIPHDGVVLAVGDNLSRKAIHEEYTANGELLISAIHPSAIIAPDAILEPGCMICAGAIVNPGCHIKGNAILNTGCTVDHDCTIGHYVHIAPGVNLAGDVTVQEGAFVGVGACAIQGVTIGRWCVVGAGAAVIDDVPAAVTAVGVPARRI